MRNMEEEYIQAKTHTPEYMLHKYWSRKPYNVIQNMLKKLLKPGETFLDPFCGSGVALREALLLGGNVIGFDINPIAYHITNITVDPPNYDELNSEIEKLLNLFSSKVNELYMDNHKEISYLVHEIVVKCKNCFSEIEFSKAIKDGRKYSCPICGNKLNYNLKNLKKTKIKQIIFQDGEVVSDEISIKKQEDIERKLDFELKYNKKFSENKRILTFLEMETKDLFTKRNFYLLTYLADLIYEINDLKLREACLILLTGSVAQCSRLIAYRNNMKTGGPAWSVPGFWVPPIHLESNPYKHLLARSKKILKGVNILNKNKNYSLDNSRIELKNSLEGIEGIKQEVDLVFFDPPYGDNIPYTEFSGLWNSFLIEDISIDNDMSVSDRIDKKIAWKSYEDNLNILLSKIRKKLSSTGKILVTFNNNDIKAWKALLKSFQENKYQCLFVKFQIPAVVSSKAQFSPEKSYIGDIYCIYQKNDNLIIETNLEIIKNKLILAACLRDYKLYQNVAYRIVTTEWLKNNIDYKILDKVEEIIREVFIQKNSILYLKDEYKLKEQNMENIFEIVKKAIEKNEKNYYEEIIEKTKDIGIPDPIELKDIISKLK